jgi:hypothetical protein
VSYDLARKAWLESRGFRVLRFGSEIVHWSDGEILGEILLACRDRLPQEVVDERRSRMRGESKTPSPLAGEGWGEGQPEIPSPLAGEGRGEGEGQPHTRHRNQSSNDPPLETNWSPLEVDP